MRILGFELTIRKATQSLMSVGDRMRGWVGRILEPFAGAWQKNMECDGRNDVLSFGPVYTCVTRIANDIAKMPPLLKELDEANGLWLNVPRNSPYWQVLRKPNRYQNRIQFLVCWVLSRLMWGNTFVIKERDQRGIVVAMYILNPECVQVKIAQDGGVYYMLAADQLNQIGEPVLVPASEIIHDRMNTLFHPLIGVSPLWAAAMSATQGRRIQTNSARFFENMSQPGGVLSAPGSISDDLAKRLKDHWETNFTGSNAGKVAVLGDGLKYEAISQTAESSQLVDQMKWVVQDIAAIFCMPLYKINAGPVPTSNNVAALNQQYYDECLQTHIESLELCLDEGLALTNAGGKVYGVELDLEVMMRMDFATKITTLGLAVDKTLMKPNEARMRLNLPPVEGGDTLYKQQQEFSLAALSRRDAQENPFAAATPAPPPTPELPAPGDEEDEAALEQARAFADALISKLTEASHAA